MRRACEVAVAIDALADRAKAEISAMSMIAIRSAVARYHHQGPSSPGRARTSRGCGKRIQTRQYKPEAPSHDVVWRHLCVGAGCVDGYGIGKFSGVEVILNLADGTQRKFQRPALQYRRLVRVPKSPWSSFTK